ncbi:ABC transporter substrate-binding protein [Magnetospirillum sp. UT-4]|uniref:substrate-binding periplasmic protein n=1 Tax=Magnetospirillum sp. UT-4 TaxID=2681467 RepID=UPI00137C661C|nr:transporter substrate-binding domain-containing protein [Magnetospirillum sp. UT-4]CAA7624573.1 putative extracellular solute-binding protein, family 3 [Magnetospirillum sp. UT-4]
MGVLRTVVLLLLAAVTASGARAETVRLLTIDAAPWASLDAAGRPAGALPAIAAELSARTGHTVTIDLMSLARMERELGEYDCTIILWSERRAALVERGEDVYPMPFGVIARKGVTLDSYDDLLPLVISVVRSLAIDPRFDADPALHKDFDTDYLQGLRKIAHRRLDAVAGAIPTIRYQALKAGLADEMGQHLTLRTVPLTLQWVRTSPRLGLLPEFNRAIQAMRADGTLDRILAANHYSP